MATIELIDITLENWQTVYCLSAGKSNEKFVAPNAYSLVQAVYEAGWVTKAIRCDQTIIGFTMYGFCQEKNFYEIARFMIDEKYQGQHYGHLALEKIINEMEKQYGVADIYLSTSAKNERGKHLYRKFGFIYTGELWEGDHGEEIYRLTLTNH